MHNLESEIIKYNQKVKIFNKVLWYDNSIIIAILIIVEVNFSLVSQDNLKILFFIASSIIVIVFVNFWFPYNICLNILLRNIN